MSATDCAECGAPDAIQVIYDINADEGHFDTLYLCRACADRREGKPAMNEQVEVLDE